MRLFTYQLPHFLSNPGLPLLTIAYLEAFIMKLATILSLLPTMVASFLLKGYIDRCCATEAFNVTNFESYGCIRLPAKASSINFDTQSFQSGYVASRHFFSEDCTGASYGQANFIDADYPIPDNQCINATPDQASFGSFYIQTYR